MDNFLENYSTKLDIETTDKQCTDNPTSITKIKLLVKNFPLKNSIARKFHCEFY